MIGIQNEENSTRSCRVFTSTIDPTSSINTITIHGVFFGKSEITRKAFEFASNVFTQNAFYQYIHHVLY